MALGGGNFVTFNKRLPGTYTRTITIGSPFNEVNNGIVAGGIISDWGPDNEIFEITAEQFISDPVTVTGYAYSDPKNQTLREIFCHANKLLAYRLNSGSDKAGSQVGEAKCSGVVGNKIVVSVLKNIMDDTKYDVTTYVDGIEKDLQVVPGLVPKKVKLTKGEETPGETVETATVAFEVGTDTVKATISNKPEGYDVRYTIKNDSDVVIAETPGIIWVDNEGDVYTLHLTPDAGDKNLKFEIALIKQQKGAKKQVIGTVAFTSAVSDDTENEGADGSKLVDNDFVIFADKALPVNAGYEFSGGKTKGSVTAANHNEFLNLIEGYSFNDLFYDGDDDGIKATYKAFTERLRDERGIYFQTVLYNYLDADYEGVVSIYNGITDSGQTKTLAPWLAGYMSAMSLADEATNRTYDGELGINTNISQSRLEALLDTGNFVFHNVTLDDVRTLEDINTFRSFTEDKNEEVSQNKVIRIVDYIHNTLASQMNRLDIGRLNNTDAGRNVLWVRVDAILSELVSIGAIEAYQASDIQVLPIEGQKNAVQINLNITVAGTIRRIYITTYVIK